MSVTKLAENLLALLAVVGITVVIFALRGLLWVP